MEISLFIALAVCAVLLGRRLFGGWFNHVSLYAVTWGGMIFLFSLRYIIYYRVIGEAWLYLFVAFMAFLGGAALPPVARRAMQGGKEEEAVPEAVPGIEEGSDARGGLVLLAAIGAGVVGLLGAYFSYNALVARFGSIETALVYGNLIYNLRNRGDLVFTFPYLDSIALAGSFLGGAAAALRRKFNPLILLPMISLILVSIAGMGRAKLLMSAILFLSGYVLFRARRLPRGVKVRRWRLAAGLLLSFLLLVAGAEVIRSNRGTTESFTGASQRLMQTRGWTLITPSIYLYFSSTHVVLSEYLEEGKEGGFWGMHTFLPVWRLIDRVGGGTKVKEFQAGYFMPVFGNTGTYIREVHSDFGPAGVFAVPFLLGAACSLLHARVRRTGSLVAGVVLGHLYVVVGLSWLVMSSRLGYWFISLISAVALAMLIEALAGRRPAQAPRTA